MAVDILPQGVEVVPGDTTPTPAYNFVLKLNMVPRGAALTAILEAARQKYQEWCKDFSCGKAESLTRNMSVVFEPFDLNARMEAFCIEQLATAGIPYAH